MSDLPEGFVFGGIFSGIKKSGKLDLALIATDRPAVMAGVYTQNIVCATSIDWNRSITPSGDFQAIVVNSGNANACTGQQGKQDNESMAASVAAELQVTASQVGVLSTGVIGVPLPIDKIKAGVKTLVAQLASDREHFELAASAITTTDQSSKTVVDTMELDGKRIGIAAMAKGAGMIGPNMATMLAIVCTDASLEKEKAQAMLQRVADRSFNRISVEGHTSTNDALMLVSSQSSDRVLGEASMFAFEQKLESVCIELAKKIPADGEGATHLIELRIRGAESVANADRIARTIASSNLVKTAVAGADPNWGRIVSAAGYSGVPIDLANTTLKVNGHIVFENGEPIVFDAATVSQAMRDQFETKIELTVGTGNGEANHWTSDLNVDYVKFNSEYTT